VWRAANDAPDLMQPVQQLAVGGNADATYGRWFARVCVGM
jgi:hypothetical protein